MQGVSLSPEAERIFQVADTLCFRLGLAIVTPEHVLAAALIILSETGVTGLPSAEALIEAAVAVHGSSDEPLANDVMWGPPRATRSARLCATPRQQALRPSTRVPLPWECLIPVTFIPGSWPVPAPRGKRYGPR